MIEKREFLARLFNAAVTAADPYQALKPYFPQSKPKGRTLVIGIGKASAQMGSAFEKLWHEADFGTLEGFVVTGKGGDAFCQYLDMVDASHPLPDENSIKAGQRAMAAVASLGADDQLIALVSGGGSALLAAPARGLDLDDKIALNQALLASGAPIHVMNAIRKQVSLVKAGRLAQLAHPAKVISYVISDVPGDDPALVSSGPTLIDKIYPADAIAFINHYHIALPPTLERFFSALTREENAISQVSDTGDFTRDEVYLIASARTSLLAAQAQARRENIEAVILSDAIEGEAREIALMHAGLAREIKRYNQPFCKPVVLLSGGETSVTLNNVAESASGGRNSEFALSLALSVAGMDGITALSADTDGIDGRSHSAGAFCDGGSVARLHALGIDPLGSLRAHQSASSFAQIGDVFTTGATGTNVNDFRAILIE